MKAMSFVLLLLAAVISFYPCEAGSVVSDDKINTHRVEMNNIALKRSLDFGGPNIMKIQHLVSSHDFQSIEAWYDTMFKQYIKDVSYESYLTQGYNTFNQGSSILLADLDLWVKTTGSYISYAARGSYKAQQGFNETQNMQRLHDEAAKDLQIAIGKNPKLMPAYTILLILASSSKMPFTANQILQEAEKNDQRTYSVRSVYMQSLQPKRGGSYQKMTVFANQTIKNIDSNPLLWALQGEVDADKADKYYDTGNYASAIESYTAALKFGDRVRWLKRRAECYEKIDQKGKSMTDFERVRYYDSLDSSVKVRFAQPAISDLSFDVKESSYIDPKIGNYNIQSYVVLPVEHHVQWLNEYHLGEGVVERNIDKIELMMMRLGKDCVERSKLDAILTEQKLSLTGLTNEKAQYVGKLINADAVIITTIPAMGRHSTQSTYFEDIDIKAVSVATGKIIWKSLLKGSVVAPIDTYNNDDTLDTIETKLYDLLEHKLKKGND